MNERLKELYQQAHSIRRYDGDPALDGNPPTVYWQGEVSAQRFAELIVKECVDLCELWNITPGSRLAKEIKQHFGVD